MEVLRATGELRQGTRAEEVEELVMKHLSRQVHLVLKFQMVVRPKNQRLNPELAGGFKYFSFSPLFEEDFLIFFRWVELKPPTRE